MSDDKENSDNVDCDSGFITYSAPINLDIDEKKNDGSNANQQLSSQMSTSEKEAELDNIDSGILVSAELSTQTSEINIDNKEDVSEIPLHISNQNDQQRWEIFYQQSKKTGDTQLHYSCMDGLEKVVAALIRLAPHACVLNIQNNDFHTPLHLATICSKPKIIRMLLIAGADPIIRDRDGNTPLHLASECGDLQCVRAIITRISQSEIQEAFKNYGIIDKSISYLKRLPQVPFDLEIRNYEGERCVHLAAFGGHVDVLRELVLCGADINSKEGKSGRTPLHIAIGSSHDLILSFLLEECKNILNIEAITYGGLTPYQFASMTKNITFQNNLMLRGAEPLTPPDTDDESDMEDGDIHNLQCISCI